MPSKSYNIFAILLGTQFFTHKISITEGLALLLIELHRLNGEAFLLNSDMIETIDVTPDTVLRLLNGHRYVVKEKVKDVYRKIIAFRKAAGYTCIIANTADEAKE